MDSVGSPNLDPNPPPRTRRRRGAPALRLTLPGLLLLLMLNGAACAGIAWLFFLYQMPKQAIVTPMVTVTQTSTFTPEPTWTETPTQTPTFTSSPTNTPSDTEAPFDPALTTPLILSLQDQAYKHLFAYQPLAFASDPGLPLTRLTSGEWDDINPAISPDGSQIAFVSNRSGYWDIYLYGLQSGTIERVTDTFDYDNHPSWSPDGQWLVFETYLEGSLEIVIRSALDTSSPAIRITNNSSADYQPAWSPQGREVAFVSDRGGSPQLYLVDLNQVDEKLVKQLTTGPQLQLSHPAWSPDGARLAWAETRSGEHNLVVLNLGQTDAQPVVIGSGDMPVWGPGGNAMFTLLKSPNSDSLMMYYLDRPGVMSPPIPLGFQTQGVDWRQSLSLHLPLAPILEQVAAVTPPPVYQPALLAGTPVPGGRQILTEIDDLQAPFPMLQDRVDEAFNALRSRLTKQIGWDYLGTLENAYIPLTAPLPPGAGNSWLYSGRAFAINSQWLNAGWMVVVREDFGTETYWRIYLKPVYQDGSAGEPLIDRPWDFLSRFDGDLKAYEQGGQYLSEIPPGYWFDFTAFAQQYNWQRLPALPTWLSAYPQARFNEFVLTDGMDWRQAMLEIYPPEIFITPSPVLPPTETPRPTSRWYVSPTPTLTLTPRPTFTPPPSMTATTASTPTATQTPGPSVTPTPSKTAAKTVTATSTYTPPATASPTVTLTPTR